MSDPIPCFFSADGTNRHALVARWGTACVQHAAAQAVDERCKRGRGAGGLKALPTSPTIVATIAPGGTIGPQIWSGDSAIHARRVARALDRCRAWRDYAALLLAAWDACEPGEAMDVARELASTPIGIRAMRAAERLRRAADRLPGERDAPKAGAIVGEARSLAHAVEIARRHGAVIVAGDDGRWYEPRLVAALVGAAAKAGGRTWAERDGTLHARWLTPHRRGGLDLRPSVTPIDRPIVTLAESCYGQRAPDEGEKPVLVSTYRPRSRKSARA